MGRGYGITKPIAADNGIGPWSWLTPFLAFVDDVSIISPQDFFRGQGVRKTTPTHWNVDRRMKVDELPPSSKGLNNLSAPAAFCMGTIP